MIKVRLNDKGVGCSKLDKIRSMMGLLCAVLRVTGHGENKDTKLCSTDHYIMFV
jgi:hypothetical protein